MRNKKGQTDRREGVASGKQGVIGGEKDPERLVKNKETGKKSTGWKVSGVGMNDMMVGDGVGRNGMRV